MERELKQRLIGAAVLVALAVIFLPMLIKGPAPDSDAADVPLDMPAAPGGEYVTRELPLVAPAGAPPGGVVGLEPGSGGDLPTVDTTEDGPPSADAFQPMPSADGEYAVSFGSYASQSDAARVVEALRGAQLAGYQEATQSGGRSLYRVRIGPFASRATAEVARLRAAEVRNDVDAGVVAINPAADEPSAPSEPEPQPQVEPDETTSVASTSAEQSAPAADPPEPRAPVASQPPADAAPDAPATTVEAGFAVQLGAFNNHQQAIELRDRARAAGFSAFIEQVSTDNGSLSRVQVGPAIDRAAAERLNAQVAARLGVNGFVHSHP